MDFDLRPFAFIHILFYEEGEHLLKVRSVTIFVIFFVLMVSPAVFGQDVAVSISDISGAAGDTVIIPVNVGNTSGLNVIAFEMTVEYDSRIMTAVSANTSGTIAGSWLIVSNATIPGQIAVSMAGSALSGSGVLVNMEFSIEPGVPMGMTSRLHFAEAVLNDGAPNAVPQDGVFTVGQSSSPPRLEGDANGDDRVDHRDLLKLVLTYNKNSGDSGYDPWADFNGDGRIDRDDVIVVWQNFGATR